MALNGVARVKDLKEGSGEEQAEDLEFVEAEIRAGGELEIALCWKRESQKARDQQGSERCVERAAGESSEGAVQTCWLLPRECHECRCQTRTETDHPVPPRLKRPQSTLPPYRDELIAASLSSCFPFTPPLGLVRDILIHRPSPRPETHATPKGPQRPRCGRTRDR